MFGLMSLVTNSVAGMGAKFWAVVILVVALTGSVGYLYWKHTSLIETVGDQKYQIEKLEGEKDSLLSDLSDANQKYADTVKKYEEARAIGQGLEEKERVYVAAIADLEGKLNKAGRDLGYLTNMKPKIVEKVVNKAAKDRNRCIEIISGKPKLEGEKNEVCPHLFTK